MDNFLKNNYLQEIEELLKIENQDFQKISDDYDDNNFLLSIYQKNLARKGCKCPNCGGINIKIHQKIQFNNRLKCQNCKITFRESSGSVLHGLHKKNLLYQYISYLVNCTSHRDIIKDIDITLETSHRWRHKLLSSLKDITWKKSDDGIIEINENNFEYSEKGTSKNNSINLELITDDSQRENPKNKAVVAFIYERNLNHSYLQFVDRGIINQAKIKSKIINKYDNNTIVLRNTIEDEDKLFYIKSRMRHLEKIPSNFQTDVIKSDSKIKSKSLFDNYVNWLQKFQGIATKYIENYINWFNLIMNKISPNDSSFIWVLDLISSVNCSHNYNNINNLHKNLWSSPKIRT